MTYKSSTNNGARTVRVEAIRTGTDVRLNVRVGNSSKSREMKPHQRMPADNTLINEAVKLAKGMIPKGATDLKATNKRG